jgi:hypothetical protein
MAGSVLRELLQWTTDSTATHTYSYTTFTTSLTYSGYGSPGGTGSADSPPSGDRVVVGHPDAGGTVPDPAEFSLNGGTGYKLGFANGDRVTGILVMFNINVRNVVHNEVGDLYPMFCVQYKVSGDATWYTIPESERFLSRADHLISSVSTSELLDVDVPLATLITADTLADDGHLVTDEVVGVRIMLSVVNAAAGVRLDLERGNASVMVLAAEES